MATYYIKDGGNDSLDGLSDANAWSTISKVQSTVTSGDTVYFRSQDTWTSASSPTLTATAGVTYDGKSYGNGTRAKITTTNTGVQDTVVKIDGNNVTMQGFDFDGNQKPSTLVWIGGSSNMTGCTIDDCIVHDNSHTEQAWIYGIEVSPTAANKTVSNTTIKNCEIYDTYHEGIAIYATWTVESAKNDGVLISNCNIHDTGTMAIGSGCAVEICNDSDNVTIENCILDGNNGYGIVVRVSPEGEGPGNVVSGPENLIVRYNMISENEVYGVFIYNQRGLAQSVSIYNNIFLNNGPPNSLDYGADINISGDGDYGDCVYSIYNNTLYNTVCTSTNSSLAASIAVGMWSDYTEDPTINIKNNIIYCGDVLPLLDRWGILTSHSNNLFYRSSGATDEHVRIISTSYDRNGSEDDLTNWEATAKKVDPLFVNATTDFHLQAGSQAINSGTELNLTEDYDGNAIKIGTYPDIGAYEYWGKFLGTQSIASIMGVAIGNVAQISGLSKSAA